MLNLTGKIILWTHVYEYFVGGVANFYNKFTTSISKKDSEGNYQNANMEVRFSNNMKEVLSLDSYDEGDRIDIEIEEAWLSCDVYQNKDGEDVRKIYIFVNNAHYIAPEEQEEKPAPKKAAKPAAKPAASAAIKKPLQKAKR